MYWGIVSYYEGMKISFMDHAEWGSSGIMESVRVTRMENRGYLLDICRERESLACAAWIVRGNS